MKSPKISIVLPTYNGEKYLKDSIESVINQTELEWELIIVNDCSTDNTLEIAKYYVQKDPRIKVISNEINKKTPSSLNIGFKMATGKYFTWTSDDNMYKPEALKHMAKILDSNQDIDLISCDMDWIDETKCFMNGLSKCVNRKSAIELAYNCNIGACFMYRASLIDKVGNYDINFFLVEDYDYWCRIALKGNIYYDDANLYIYRYHTQALTCTSSEQCALLSYQVRLKYSIPIIEKYATNYLFKILAMNKLYKRDLTIFKKYIKQSLSSKGELHFDIILAIGIFVIKGKYAFYMILSKLTRGKLRQKFNDKCKKWG